MRLNVDEHADDDGDLSEGDVETCWSDRLSGSFGGGGGMLFGAMSDESERIGGREDDWDWDGDGCD